VLDQLNALVSPYIGLIVLGLAVVVLLLVLAVVVLVRRSGRLRRRLESLTRGSDAASLEDVLGNHMERVRQVVRDVDTVAARTALLERDVQGAFARVGLVRFNPFEDTGGNQSFALALLDGRGDGFVVSSLHARAVTRIYAKAIAGGASEAALSSEEAEALRQALGRPAPGTAGGSSSASG
jgi:Na+-transporting methylmalonyl-CoA/oxaloacetate decarboxylase gamma subunit